MTLDLPELIRVKSNTFNVSDLREHVARPADLPRSAPSQPPPVFTDAAGVPSYEIDKITAHELTKRGGVKYLIRWQGFAPANDTWQYETELLTQHGGRVAVGQYRASTRCRSHAILQTSHKKWQKRSIANATCRHGQARGRLSPQLRRSSATKLVTTLKFFLKFLD